MAVRKVALMGHPVLRKVAEPVQESEITQPKTQRLISDMLETMMEYDGIGLAAPQIHESVQLVMMIWNYEGGPAEDEFLMEGILCLINPEIESLTTDTSTFWEGCLSVPGIRGEVTRPNKVSVRAFNHQGKRIEFIAEGFPATVVQHECDHLTGKLYVDRITDTTKLAFDREYRKFHIPREDD